MFIKMLIFTLCAEKVTGMLAEGVQCDEDCPLNVVWSLKKKNEPSLKALDRDVADPAPCDSRQFFS